MLVPIDCGRIPQGIWIYASCRPAGLLAGAVSGLAVAAHPRLVPGARVSWRPPHQDIWDAWREAMRRATVEVAAWVVALPSDPRRARFNVLAVDHQGRHSVFVKFKRAHLDLPHMEALRALRGSASFWAPSLVASGAAGAWSFVATTPMPPGPHRPARLTPDTRRRLVAEIRSMLPPASRPGWVAMHGDLGPWNVRTIGFRRLAVVDWEETSEGPMSADEVWHAATWHLVHGVEPVRAAALVASEIGPGSREAAAFWLARLGREESEEIDPTVSRPHQVSQFEQGVRACLEQLAAG